ncbi:hypothetical protein ACOSP7_027917 [Xanthoceras sorbifolium]|uniref:Peptidase metallopeptidase domain-containing protein n=1 Tax=Xanthoceras sorbifolium TaxID=99658 RepID=A0ABQ8HDU0_9ROSI|nr:hypothetical protein JRO89_XS12G0256500 [Xanthoceras sorbifolium]
MASKYVSLFSLALLVLLSLLVDHSVSGADTKKKSSVEFLKHLQGCHKGDKVKGILELKKYLEKFGYLDYKNAKNRSHENDDDFDDLLESAVKTYQLNFHVKSSGVLDRKTLSKMAKPRCGDADIVNGTNWMKKTHHHQHGSGSPFHTVAHYSFFQGSPRWPAAQTHLTYAFLPGTRGDAMGPVARAFQTWQANTHFRFSRVEDSTNANIKIRFARGDHGDGNPFDGPGRTIAHAFAPPDGRFHYDADETWAVGAVPGANDLETVALHEIGHLLGLGHSEVEGAIMWPSITVGSTKGLHRDDIEGIRALYNV